MVELHSSNIVVNIVRHSPPKKIVNPSNFSCYLLRCFRNLLHGLSLYLCLLLLSHLSDFQHRGVWLWLVGAVVFVPLLVTIAILVIDLRLPPGAEGR